MLNAFVACAALGLSAQSFAQQVFKITAIPDESPTELARKAAPLMQYLAQKLGMQALPFTIAGVLTGVIVAAFGWIMPARTVAGARARLGVLGFEDFLGRVEGDRLERMTSATHMTQAQTFERYLPFAMALGVEKKWAAAFDGVFKEPPSWYRAPPGTMFRGMYFANSLSAMSARASQVLASAPRGSSGSSGFGGRGGGGYSGGGFGGGGGGGW